MPTLQRIQILASRVAGLHSWPEVPLLSYEDVRSEVIAALLQFEKPSYCRARWAAVDYTRSQLGRGRERRKHEQLREDMADEADNPSDCLTRSDLRKRLASAVNSMPDHYRAPLIEVYWRGRTAKEASQSIGIGKAAISMRLKEARELLRLELSKN